MRFLCWYQAVEGASLSCTAHARSLGLRISTNLGRAIFTFWCGPSWCIFPNLAVTG